MKCPKCGNDIDGDTCQGCGLLYESEEWIDEVNRLLETAAEEEPEDG